MNIIPNHVQLSNRFCVYWVSAEIFSERFNSDPKVFWEAPYINRLRLSDVVVRSGEVVKCRHPIETLIAMALSPHAFYSDYSENTDGPRMEHCTESKAAEPSSDHEFNAEETLKTWRAEWGSR